jgi:hypothetical protein
MVPPLIPSTTVLPVLASSPDFVTDISIHTRRAPLDRQFESPKAIVSAESPYQYVVQNLIITGMHH